MPATDGKHPAGKHWVVKSSDGKTKADNTSPQDQTTTQPVDPSNKMGRPDGKPSQKFTLTPVREENNRQRRGYPGGGGRGRGRPRNSKQSYGKGRRANANNPNSRNRNSARNNRGERQRRGQQNNFQNGPGAPVAPAPGRTAARKVDPHVAAYYNYQQYNYNAAAAWQGRPQYYMLPPHYQFSYGYSIPYVQAQTPADIPADYVAIKRQLEFYFSETNLVRDAFLRGLMNDEGYVDSIKLSQFPRMRRGGIRPEEIIIAAGMSAMLDIKDNAVRAKHHWSHFTNTSRLPAKPPTTETKTKGEDKTESLVGKLVEANGESIPSEFQKKECTVLGVIDQGEKVMVQLKDNENKCAIVPAAQLQGLTVTGDED